MISSYTAAQVHEAEQAVMSSTLGSRLMDQAAAGAAIIIQRELRRRRGFASGSNALMLVGKGNNGGDTLFAGARLAGRGARVTAVAVAKTVHQEGVKAFLRAGGRLLTLVEGGEGLHVSIDEVAVMARRSDAIIDGMLGIGGRGSLSGHAAAVVSTLTVEAGLSGPMRYRNHDRPIVIAIDLPSGVGVDDGTTDGRVLPADLTVTFGAIKPAAILPPAVEVCGQVETIDIGLDETLRRQNPNPAVRRLTPQDVRDLWPIPRPHDHKYSRGVLGVVAGSETYPGAAVLTTSAAVRTGVGMVRYIGPDKAVERVISGRPEVVPGGGRVSAFAVGPGVAASEEDQLQRVNKSLSWAMAEKVPTVVDAGAFAVMPEKLAPWMVLTPHAGELATLLSDRGFPVERTMIEDNPAHYARLASELTGATVLLKGSASVVATPGGRLYVQDDGTPWLATAGTGDVLTGILGALLSGHGNSVAIDPDLPGKLAALAAMVHGRAGVAASGDGPLGGREDNTIGHPIAAMDVVGELPHTINELLHT